MARASSAYARRSRGWMDIEWREAGEGRVRKHRKEGERGREICISEDTVPWSQRVAGYRRLSLHTLAQELLKLYLELPR